MEILFDNISNESNLNSVSHSNNHENLPPFFVESYDVIVSPILTVETLAQVRAHHKKMENTSSKIFDILLLGHHL
jgi:hypothetical protein